MRVYFLNRTENNGGSILIYTLIVLTILTLLGAIGIQTTLFELKLSANDHLINRLKIKAESTALAAVALIDSQPSHTLKDSDWESSTRMNWLSRGKDNQFDRIDGAERKKAVNEYIRNTSNWQNKGRDPNCALLETESDDEKQDFLSEQFGECRFQVLDMGAAPGSSLQTGNRLETLHNLYITGYSRERIGKCLVQIGYRKRF